MSSAQREGWGSKTGEVLFSSDAVEPVNTDLNEHCSSTAPTHTPVPWRQGCEWEAFIRPFGAQPQEAMFSSTDRTPLALAPPMAHPCKDALM